MLLVSYLNDCFQLINLLFDQNSFELNFTKFNYIDNNYMFSDIYIKGTKIYFTGMYTYNSNYAWISYTSTGEFLKTLTSTKMTI